MLLTTREAPDLVPVLVMPFTILLLCCALGLAIYIGWGRMKRTH